MSPLPDGWRHVVLNDVLAGERGAITDGPFGSNLASRHYTNSGARVIRLGNIGDGFFVDAPAFISMDHYARLTRHDAKPGDLVVASLGEVLPRACLVPEGLGPAIVKADCIRVRLAEHVDPKWVLYAMQSPAVRAWAARQVHGVGRPRLGLKVIREMPLSLPPKQDQRRIVAILEDHLSRLDAAAASLAAVQRRLSGLVESTLRAELVGALRSGCRKPAHLPDDVGLVDGVLEPLPSGWRWIRLHQIAEVVGGVTKDAKRQGDPTYVEVPYLRVANVQRGRLDLERVASIRVPPSRAQALRLEPGDVLLNEGGDRDKLGRGWVWEGQVDECIHQNHVFRARVRDGVLDPRLLSWAANVFGGPWCDRNAAQSVNLASISLTKIRQMPIPVPPGDVQPAMVERILERLEAVDTLRSAIQVTLQRHESLRRSLLEAAFTGGLERRAVQAASDRQVANV